MARPMPQPPSTLKWKSKDRRIAVTNKKGTFNSDGATAGGRKGAIFRSCFDFIKTAS